MRYTHWLVLLMATATGCGTADRPVQGDLVIDPAAADLDEILLSLDSPRLWSFGGAKENIDDELLRSSGVMGLAPLSGGGYLLSEGERVRTFDRSGRETWRHGREGAGPQEYRSLGWPCTVGGDTVVVTDQRNRRFPFIATGDSIVSMVPGGGRWIRSGYCSGKGWALTGEIHSDSLNPDGMNQYRRLYPDGSTSEVLFTGPADDRWTIGKGSVSAGVVGDMLFLADPNSSEVTLYDSAGVELRRLSLRLDRVPVTEASIAELTEMEAPFGTSPEVVKQVLAEALARPRTKVWPAFETVESDGRGLWIKTRNDHSGSAWLVISPEGVVQAKVRSIPFHPESGRFSVIHFVPDGPVVRFADDDDMLHIAVLDVWR